MMGPEAVIAFIVLAFITLLFTLIVIGFLLGYYFGFLFDYVFAKLKQLGTFMKELLLFLFFYLPGIALFFMIQSLQVIPLHAQELWINPNAPSQQNIDQAYFFLATHAVILITLLKMLWEWLWSVEELLAISQRMMVPESVFAGLAIMIMISYCVGFRIWFDIGKGIKNSLTFLCELPFSWTVVLLHSFKVISHHSHIDTNAPLHPDISPALCFIFTTFFTAVHGLILLWHWKLIAVSKSQVIVFGVFACVLIITIGVWKDFRNFIKEWMSYLRVLPSTWVLVLLHSFKYLYHVAHQANLNPNVPLPPHVSTAQIFIAANFYMTGPIVYGLYSLLICLATAIGVFL